MTVSTGEAELTFHEFLEVAFGARRVPDVLEVFLEDSEERVQKLVGFLR